MESAKNAKQYRRTTRGHGSDGRPNPVDAHVGARVRLRRTLLGMSQEELGGQLGLTFQQVQKYERGANRIGSSRLFDLARILEVPVGFFFDDLAEEVAGDCAPGPCDPVPMAPEVAAVRHETLELVRAYYRITDPLVRRRVYDLTRALGDGLLE